MIDHLARMGRVVHCALFVGGVLAVASLTRAQSPLPDPFRDGTRWCFVGDEVTHRGSYVTWVTAYVVTRFPDRLIDVSNAGMQGDTAARALSRFEWDVAVREPTLVTVFFGLGELSGMGRVSAPAGREGDAGQRGEPADAYRLGLREWVSRVRAVNAVPWIVGPGIYDARGEGLQESFNDRLAWHAAIAREVAEETACAFSDLNGPLGRMAQELPGAESRPVGGDLEACVSDPVGQLLIAGQLLRQAGATSEVASLTIDLRSGRFVAGNSTVDKVVRGESDLTFVWTARALPLPLPDDGTSATRSAAILEDLSRELLVVAGLKPGRWVLSIDGVRVAEFSHEQWESGVNLAMFGQTPQNRQARDVWRLLEARQSLVAENLRAVSWVEYVAAPAATRPIGSEKVRSILDSLASDARGGSTYEREAFALYDQRKMREAASVGGAARLLVQARHASQPQAHVYQLKLTK